MKKLVYYIGVLFIALTIIINLVFTAKMQSNEHVDVMFNNIFFLIGTFILAATLFALTNITNKYLVKEDKKQ